MTSNQKSRHGRALFLTVAACLVALSLWACDFERRKYLPARIDSFNAPRKQLVPSPSRLSPSPSLSTSPSPTSTSSLPPLLEDPSSSRTRAPSNDSLPTSAGATLSPSSPSSSSSPLPTSSTLALSSSSPLLSSSSSLSSSQSSSSSSSFSPSLPSSSDSSSESPSHSKESSTAAIPDSAPDQQQHACVAAAGLSWKPHPRNRTTQGKLMSTSQWTEEPSGFASRCDWVIGSRAAFYGLIAKDSCWGDTSKHPRTVFVRTDAIPFFVTDILPCLSRAFVLVTGDSDATVPRQLDANVPWRMEAHVWNALLEDRRVMHIFAENLDVPSPAKVTGIPAGFDPIRFPGISDQHIMAQAPLIDLRQRPLKVLDVQWPLDEGLLVDGRKRASCMCQSEWREFCEYSAAGPETFMEEMRRYPFIMCVRGSGLDPGPEAFEALLLGSIPIVRRYPGDHGYRELPVVLVEDWDTSALSSERLSAWREQLAPYFEEPELRAGVLERLHLGYWWDKVEAALAADTSRIRKEAMAIDT